VALARRAALLVGLSGSAIGASAARTAQAGGAAATDAYEGVREGADVDAHFLVDLYFLHRAQGPTGGRVPFRAFDVRNDVPSASLVRLTLARRPGPFGFRLDLGAGDMQGAYLAADPASSTHPEASRALSFAQQAFVTLALPVGRGVAVDAGKFDTPVGLEDNATLANWNASRGLLFTLAEPTYHFGLRTTYPLTDDLAVSAFWLNGWNTNVLEGSGMRSFAAALGWKAQRRIDAGLVYAGGLERAPTRLSDPALDFRHELAAYASYAVRTWLSFAATTDYGVDARPGGGSWWGAGGYVRWRPSDWLALNARGEHFADPAGFLTAAAQDMVEATFTLEATERLGGGTLVVRFEVRRDRSTAPVFPARGPRAVPRQDTVGVTLQAAF
jgi:hypothetical protein